MDGIHLRLLGHADDAVNVKVASDWLHLCSPDLLNVGGKLGLGLVEGTEVVRASIGE